MPKYAKETASCQSIRNELPVAGHVGGRFAVYFSEFYESINRFSEESMLE